MEYHEKQRVLNSIATENELRKELVIPLLKKMKNFSDVLDNQGPNEAGVDVIGVSTSPFKKPEYTAFVLKLGDITLKVADQKNNLVNIVETQIRQALKHPLTHPRLSDDKAYASRVVVIANGSISNNAEGALRKAFPHMNVDFVAQDRLIDKLDELWPRFYEDRRPFLSSYAIKLFSNLDVVNLEELGYAKKRRSLTDIYIDSVLYEEESVERRDLFNFDRDPIAGEKLCSQPHRLIAVMSGPGGGKTTLLKEIAISESKDKKDQAAVYLHVRDVLESKDILRTSADILSQISHDASEDVLEELKDTKLLLLVDGLDELASTDDRVSVIERLVEAQTNLNARVILSTRPESNPNVLAALSAFKAFSISPLRKSQISNFFGKWFQQTDRAGRLMEALEDKGVFDKLPKTPMTMTLVAIVYESKEDIPSTLTELYEMFVDLLTGKWDANRKVASPFDSQMKLSFLGRLAATMQFERLDTISDDRCLTLAEEFFRNEATLKNVDVRAFIQSIIDRSHILIPGGENQLRFSHMTFQEYFCADHLIHNFPSDETISEWFGDDWWKEVLFFLAGKRKNISRIIDRLLEEDFEDPDTRMTKLVTLGSMLQAGILTNSASKIDAIRFASFKFIHCIDDLQAALSKIASKKIRSRVTRFILLSLLQQLFTGNFCSIYLHQALEDLYKSLPAKKENEAARFFVASALGKMRDFEPLLEFATEPEMIDTPMYILASMDLSKQQLSADQQEAYRRLRKRMSQFQQAIKKELKPLLQKGAAKRIKGRRKKRHG